VFFNLFFEEEPFAAILIAHVSHGRSQKFVSRSTVKFEDEGQARRKTSCSKLLGLGELCNLPQWGSGRNPDRKCILDAL